jgi:GAF domain-containing protein
MSRKKLRNQLEDFFDELEIEASIPPEPEPPAAQGWTWECDLHGTITACSPEIQAVLGYSPDDALGQNIGSFALQVESSQQVKKALSQQSFSAEIETCFVTVNGEELPGRIHFLMTEKPGAKNGKPATVKGFTQIEAGPRSSTLEGQNPAIEVNDLPGEAASAEEVISTSEDGFQSESASLAELESIPDLASGEGEKPIEVIPELDPGDDPAAWLAEISYSPAINAEIDPDSIHSDVSFNETLAEAELKLEEDASTEGSSQSGNHFGVEDTRLSGVQPDEDVEVESNAGEQEMPTVQHLEDDGLEEAFDSSEEQSAEPVDELGSGIPHAFTNTENEAGGPVFGESPPVQQSSSTPSPDSQSKTLQMPIRVQNKTRGLLELVDDDPQRQWSSEEQRLVEEVLDQLSLALENAELFQQTQVALSETERLYKISADFNAADTLEEILKSMSVPNDAGVSPFAVTLWQFETDKTGQPVEMTYTNLWAEPGRVVKSHIGTQISLADYSGSRVLLGNPSEPQLIGDTAQDPLDEATREMVLYNAGAAVVFLPLAIREHWIGMINILWDHPTQFNERDRNRYRSLAAQAAITINNRLLFEQTEHRARQLEWLSMIKDSLSQATDEAGILSAVSMALDLAMPPQWIALLYFDLDGMGEIRGARTSAFWKDGMILEAIPEWDTRSFLTTLQSLNIFERFPDRAYVISDARSPEDSPEALRVAAEEQKFRGFGVLPLYSSGRWQGAIAFGWPVVYELSVNEAFYLKEILEPLAAFIASRRSYLAEQEARQAMERRNLQLQTAAQVSRAASSILDPDTLVKDTVEIVKKRFDLYYVGLFLVDQAAPKSKESAGWALLKAGTGEAGRIMLERGHKLEIDGPSMIGKCIALNQAQIWRGDQDEVQYRFSNPLLPDTRSEMALPLVSRGEVMGAMTFQSQQAGDFSEADISVLQTMADQVANAIQNARLYAQSEAALSETSTLYTIASAASRSMELSQMLDEVLFQTLETTNFEAGVISIYNSDANRLELTAHRNLPDELVNRFKLHGLDGTLCALVYNRKEAVAVPNLKENAPLDVQALI